MANSLCPIHRCFTLKRWPEQKCAQRPLTLQAPSTKQPTTNYCMARKTLSLAPKPFQSNRSFTTKIRVKRRPSPVDSSLTRIRYGSVQPNEAMQVTKPGNHSGFFGLYQTDRDPYIT